MIEVKNVNKKYNNFLALNNVSFNIKKGSIVGLLGPNGAGKSTTMRILSTYIKPTSGKIKINNIDILKYPDKIKNIIGYLPENVPLYNEMKVIDYMKYRSILKNYSLKKNELNEIFENLKIKNVKNKIIGNLSKGYRQRVGLADTLINKPKIILLDEPTSGLDPEQRLIIANYIKQLSNEITFIISSHILSEIENICNNIIIINKGNIIIHNDFKKEDFYFLKIKNIENLNITDILKKISVIKKFEIINNIEDIFNIKISFYKKEDIDYFYNEIKKFSLIIRELRKYKNNLENTYLKLIKNGIKT